MDRRKISIIDDRNGQPMIVEAGWWASGDILLQSIVFRIFEISFIFILHENLFRQSLMKIQPCAEIPCLCWTANEHMVHTKFTSVQT